MTIVASPLEVVVTLACVVAFVGAVGYEGLRRANRRRLRALTVALREARYADALAVRPPRGEFAAVGDRLRGIALIAKGRFASGLELFDGAAADPLVAALLARSARPDLLRRSALLVLGRYPEVVTDVNAASPRMIRLLAAGAATQLAQDELAEALLQPQPGEAPSPVLEGLRLATLADLRCLQGRFAEAAEALDQGAALEPEMTSRVRARSAARRLVAQARLHLQDQRPGLALELTDRARSALAPVAPDTGDAAQVARVAAQALSALGRHESAREQLGLARACAARCEDPAPTVARTEEASAQVEAAAGRRDMARRHYHRALEIFTGLHAVRHIQRVEQQLREL